MKEEIRENKANIVFVIIIIIEMIIIAGLIVRGINESIERVTSSKETPYGDNFILVDHVYTGCDIVYHKSTKVIYAIIRSQNYDRPGILSPLYDSDGSILLYDPEDWDSLNEDVIT